MEEVVNVISTVGFPIAVAVYCLVVQNKTMVEMTNVLSDNTQVLTQVLSKLTTLDIKS